MGGKVLVVREFVVNRFEELEVERPSMVELSNVRYHGDRVTVMGKVDHNLLGEGVKTKRVHLRVMFVVNTEIDFDRLVNLFRCFIIPERNKIVLSVDGFTFRVDLCSFDAGFILQEALDRARAVILDVLSKLYPDCTIKVCRS